MITLTIQGETLQEVIAKLNAALPQAPNSSAPVAAPVVANSDPVPPLPTPAIPSIPVVAPVMAPAAQVAQVAQAAPAAPVTAPVVPAQIPTQAPTYSQEDIMRAAAALMDAGKAPQIQQAIAELGAPHFGALPPERYGEFALKLKTLGAQL